MVITGQDCLLPGFLLSSLSWFESGICLSHGLTFGKLVAQLVVLLWEAMQTLGVGWVAGTRGPWESVFEDYTCLGST